MLQGKPKCVRSVMVGPRSELKTLLPAPRPSLAPSVHSSAPQCVAPSALLYKTHSQDTPIRPLCFAVYTHTHPTHTYLSLRLVAKPHILQLHLKAQSRYGHTTIRHANLIIVVRGGAQVVPLLCMVVLLLVVVVMMLVVLRVLLLLQQKSRLDQVMLVQLHATNTNTNANGAAAATAAAA